MLNRTLPMLNRTLAVWGLLLPGAALAGQSTQTACHTDLIQTALTNWQGQVTIPKFDPNLGILTGVHFELTGEVTGSAQVESLDPTATTVTTSFQATITLTRPDLSVLVVTTPAANFLDDLSPFDGTIDFAGTSGASHLNIAASATETADSPPPAGDLTLFTGPAGNPGTISLPVEAVGTSFSSGSGNLITQFQTSAGASVLVCYNYELDCNGNGVPDSQDIGQGTSPDADHNGVPDECEPGTEVFCVGTGVQNGGVDCPCGNEVPPSSAAGCQNGTGSGATLAAAGLPSVSNDTLTLTVSGLPPNGPGIFFFGTQMLNGGSGQTFGSGLRCIGNVTRLNKIPGGGGGSLPSGSMPPLHILTGAVPGDRQFYQFWYRDYQGPCHVNVNATNGVMVVWGL